MYSVITLSFLGAFAKLRKATISFVVSVSPSVCTEQFGCHWTDYHEIWYLSIVWKYVDNNSNFVKIWEFLVLQMKTNIHLSSYLARFFLEWEMSRTKVAEKNMRVMFSHFFIKKTLPKFFSPFHSAFWFTKFFHTNSCTFTYNHVLVLSYIKIT
jgi:hypothetical protein